MSLQPTMTNFFNIRSQSDLWVISSQSRGQKHGFHNENRCIDASTALQSSGAVPAALGLLIERRF